ncbi:hypothetical protein [Streptomyces cavernae]|uniref:hypothetical protein n=1 Tax=Streptomyces cavernae TaxID=2259034 RepID=UPI000FEBDA0D|nr:hypothetical protein [Streptomyces cavernae]
MARHSAHSSPAVRRAALAVTTAGMALGAGAGTAFADTAVAADGSGVRPAASPGSTDPRSGLQALTGNVRYVAGPAADLKPNPLAGTGVDPLDNGVGTQIADFRPVDSRDVTRPVAQAESLGSVPGLGRATGLLPG